MKKRPRRAFGMRSRTSGQAASLGSHAELMQQIAASVKRQVWTQAEAPSHCRATQPQIDDLLRGRVSRFSLDALVNISAALGVRVLIDFEGACVKPLATQRP